MYDIYDVLEVKPKNKKFKIIIASILAILVLILLIGLFIIIKKNNSNNTKENIEISTNESDIENNTNHKNKHISVVNFLPNYTENAKQGMNNIYHSSEKIAYLTFDDGPSKSVTPLILDLLKNENIKATFFVLGNRVELYPDIVKREYKEGHYIANHGYTHSYQSIYASVQATLDEYYRTQNVIKNALGIDYDGHLFRFPGGSTGGRYRNIKNEIKGALQDNGISYVDWNALSQDAAGAKTKEALIDNIKQTVGEKNCVVILMHDASDKILTYETLPDVIAYLREKGYRFENFYNIMK